MAMTQLSADAEDFKIKSRRLMSHMRLLDDPAELKLRVNATIAAEGLLREIVDERFETEGRSAGETWAPLSPLTQAQRRKQGFGAAGPILERSGILREHVSGGDQEVTSDGISLKLRDGPAPIYMGKGKTLNKWIEKTFGAKGTKKIYKDFRKQFTGVGANLMLSDYAGALNDARPFLGELGRDEQRLMTARFSQLLEQALDLMWRGKSINDLLASV